MSTRGNNIQAEILTVLRDRSVPQSAYDLLAALRETHAKLAPPTIYRALAALTEQGRVHRVESLNAFVACCSSKHDQSSIMSICNDCGSVEERIAPDLLKDLTSLVGKGGFAPERHVIEVHGLCASCNPGHAS